MRHAPSTLHFSHAFRLAAAGGIEWEELPSLVERVRARQSGVNSSSAAWDSTRPAPFEAAPMSAPFREPMHGVAIREVIEPEVFRHFFGR